MIAYKYRTDFVRDIELLKKGKIYVPTIDKLNDPCEGLLIENIFFDNLLSTLNPAGKQGFESLLKKRYEIGVWSMSRRYDDEIVWAHYADGHKGFCIEFDVPLLIDFYYMDKNAINYAHVFDVKYDKHPPQTSDIIKCSGLKECCQFLLGTKSERWSYEEEIRVIFENSEIINIDHRAIKAIYFGARADKNDMQYVMDNLKFDVKFYQMRMGDDYKFYREEIKRIIQNVDYHKTDISSLEIDKSDDEFSFYEKYINLAITIVEQEPYLEKIYYAGIDRQKIQGKALIKIIAYRDLDYVCKNIPVKFFYFELRDKKLVRIKNF